MSSKDKKCPGCDGPVPKTKGKKPRKWCSQNCATKMFARKEQETNPELVRQRRKAFRLSNPDSVRNSEYKKRYGITLAQYNDLHAKQNGMCAICSTPGKLVVDHCHTTGKIRGLLHANCNSAIGLMKDSVEIAMGAASYLATKGVY